MATQVRPCPRCFKLMWLKEELLEHEDENTIRTTCPHCKSLVRVRLVIEGPNATGPKMGH